MASSVWSCRSGTSVMAAAMTMGTQIPKLCATDSLEAFGSCRLCLVQIEGRRGFPASCTTPAEEAMIVHTQNGGDRQKRRRGVMELYISDHPLNCLTCSANGDCELQDMAGKVGLRDVRYGYAGENHLSGADRYQQSLFLRFESSKCIACSRCIRACEEIQGTFALTMEGRGFASKHLSRRHRFHGLGMRVLRRLRAGVPDRDAEREIGDCLGHTGTFGDYHVRLLRRGVLVQGGNEGRNRRAHGTLQGRAARIQGHSCVKGRFAFGYATHKDRKTKPMIRASITDPLEGSKSWDEAIGHAASPSSGASQAKYGRDRRSAALRRPAAPTRRRFWFRS